MTTVVAEGVVEIVEVVDAVDVVVGGIVVVRFGSVVVELDCGVGVKVVVVFCVGVIVVVFGVSVVVVVLGVGVVVVVLGVVVIVVVFCMGVLDVVDSGMGTGVVDLGVVLLFWDVDETIVVFKACEVGGFVV